MSDLVSRRNNKLKIQSAAHSDFTSFSFPLCLLFLPQELTSLHPMQQLVLMPPTHLSSPSPFLLSQSPTSHQGLKKHFVDTMNHYCWDKSCLVLLGVEDRLHFNDGFSKTFLCVLIQRLPFKKTAWRRGKHVVSDVLQGFKWDDSGSCLQSKARQKWGPVQISKINTIYHLCLYENWRVYDTF